MATFDPNLPPEIDAQQQSIAHQQAIAEAMLQRSTAPLQGSHLHWTQALAQVLNARQARADIEGGDKARVALGQQYQSGLANEVKRISALRQGQTITPDPQEVQQANDQGTPEPRPTSSGNPRAAIEAALVSQYAPVRQMGVLEHKTFENEQTKAADREARSYDRLMALEAAAQNQSASREDRAARADEAAALRRELAAQSDATRRELANQSKTPPGYRTKPDGSMEAIPGGPADTKLQGVFNQDTSALQSSEAALDRLAAQVNLVKNSNLGRITGKTGVLPNIPGSEGSDAKARLDALKYQVGFGVLQEMKNNSRSSSSGLGQVTEKEHVYLQGQLGNLERAQSEEEVRRVLDDIEKFAKESRGRLRAAYNLKHGAEAQRGASAAPKAPRVVDW